VSGRRLAVEEVQNLGRETEPGSRPIPDPGRT
jgi:hypothetical protein